MWVYIVEKSMFVTGGKRVRRSNLKPPEDTRKYYASLAGEVLRVIK